MIFFKQAGQERFSGGGGDGVAEAVGFRKGFDFVEIVVQRKVGPAVGREHLLVKLGVELAEFVDGGQGLLWREGERGAAVGSGDAVSLRVLPLTRRKMLR